ncbi:MAG: Rrf2 family transcriptional regulator [Planctomycetes bacterium]|nr:Rrf2 family transcriptional regulator [Planctomycetota bacterium]
MKMNVSIMYGITATGYVAQNCQDGPVLTAKVAKEFNIPMAYLQKIMKQLVMANILRSKRGPTGGFSLARPAGDISLLEVWEAVDGPLRSHLEMAQLTNKAAFATKMEEICEEGTTKAKSVLAAAKLSSII